MWIADSYRRWRHGRGFGVHSPYAYRMVREVLRLPDTCGYYAYADIARERVRLRAPLRLADAFLIYRLAVEFAPRDVVVAARGPLERLLRDIASMAAPEAEVSHRPRRGAGAGTMVIAFDRPDFPYPAGADAYCACGGLALVPGELPAGHVYRNPSRAVVAARPHLPFQVFDIRF